MRRPPAASTRGHIVIDDVVKIYDPAGAAVMAVMPWPATFRLAHSAASWPGTGLSGDSAPAASSAAMTSPSPPAAAGSGPGSGAAGPGPVSAGTAAAASSRAATNGRVGGR